MFPRGVPGECLNSYRRKIHAISVSFFVNKHRAKSWVMQTQLRTHFRGRHFNSAGVFTLALSAPGCWAVLRSLFSPHVYVSQSLIPILYARRHGHFTSATTSGSLGGKAKDFPHRSSRGSGPLRRPLIHGMYRR